jgi:polysaccharide biosynthesis transport protein
MATHEKTIDPYVRDLYTRLGLADHNSGHKVVGVTSAINGEGKTTLALQIARVRAEDLNRAHVRDREHRVVVVDCSGSLAEHSEQLGIEPAPGFIQYLRGKFTLGEIAFRVTQYLYVVPLGGSHEEFSSLIRTTDLPAFWRDLRDQFETAILDMPSVLVTSDTHLLAEYVDELVLVVRSQSTPLTYVEAAIHSLGESRVAGIALNDHRDPLPAWIDSRL